MVMFRVKKLLISTDYDYQIWDVYRQSKYSERHRLKFDKRKRLGLSGELIMSSVSFLSFFVINFIIFLCRYDVFALDYQGGKLNECTCVYVWCSIWIHCDNRLILHFLSLHSFTIINRCFSSNVTNKNQLNKRDSTSFSLTLFPSYYLYTRRNIEGRERTSVYTKKRTMMRRKSVCNFLVRFSLSLFFPFVRFLFINSKRRM